MPKVPEGFTVLKSGNVRWRVMVHGHRYTGTAPTLGEAKIARARAEIDGGGNPVLSPTVAELLDAHLQIAKRGSTTIGNWQWARNHLPATFLDRRAVDVSPAVVDALWRQLTRDGAPPHRLIKTGNLCSTAWQSAQRLGMVRDNPWRVAPAPPPPPAGRVVPPSPEHVRTLLTMAHGVDVDLELFVRLASRTGARGGELCALRPEDLHVASSELAIGPSVTRQGEITEGKTRRRGHRVVPLDLPTATALRRHIDAADREWVFQRDDGAPWRPDKPAQAIAKLCDSTRPKPKQPRVIDISPHDLRHFAVTQWLGDLVPVATVAELIGDSPRTVMQTYAHWIPRHGRDAVERLGRRLDGTDG